MSSRFLQFLRKVLVRPQLKPSAGSGSFMASKPGDRLVWVDLEMTGLDVNTDTIMEIACIITDKDLNIVVESPGIIIHQSDEVLGSMNEWCITHHGESGLTEACRQSTVSLAQAEEQILTLVQAHTPPGRCPLAGNSIHHDKMFLVKYMPRLMEHLHYRIVDVSSIKELCRRWYPRQFAHAPKKELKHRAIDDVRESIAELKYYRKTIFKSTS